MDYNSLIKDFCNGTDRNKYRMFNELYIKLTDYIGNEYSDKYSLLFNLFNLSSSRINEIMINDEIPAMIDYCQLLNSYIYAISNKKEIILSLIEYFDVIVKYKNPQN